MPAVQMFDYRAQLAGIRAEIEQAIAAVLDSGWLILGDHVREFEQSFGRYLGVSGQAVGVGNGTDAIAIALRALEIGAGDEVVTVANTAIPTASGIRMVGATPVFCDVDADTLLMDPAAAERCITARTKALVPVHLYGGAVDMPRVLEIARRHGLRVIEDCAQSCGTTLDGRATGTWGDVGCFSFYPTKNLGAYGDAGLCFARDAQLADALRQIRVYGCAKTYYSEREGVNSRLDEVQAAILGVKLRYLDAWVAQRRAIAATYDRLLDQRVFRPGATPGTRHSYHLYVVGVEHRARILERLAAEEIGHGIHYPTPLHLMRGFAFLGYAPGSLPVTERAAERILSLPCYPELPQTAVETVCRVLNSAIRDHE